MMDESKMHITTCTRCGVENDTVHWRYPHHNGGILIGIFCAACAEKIEAEETQVHALPATAENVAEPVKPSLASTPEVVGLDHRYMHVKTPIQSLNGQQAPLEAVLLLDGKVLARIIVDEVTR